MHRKNWTKIQRIYNVWKKLYVDPYYVMPLEKDTEGNREGEFRLGISYRL